LELGRFGIARIALPREGTLWCLFELLLPIEEAGVADAQIAGGLSDVAAFLCQSNGFSFELLGVVFCFVGIVVLAFRMR
jgi:hypothetical protein